jgi:hypothetical protein
MAHEAGLRIAYTEVAPWLVRYTALVAAPLEEEIKRLRFCIPEGDAAAAMEYLAYCVEKDVAKEQERCIEIVERELERLFDRDAIPICKRIATVIRENK